MRGPMRWGSAAIAKQAHQLGVLVFSQLGEGHRPDIAIRRGDREAAPLNLQRGRLQQRAQRHND
jgi:hypothetical protein